MVLELKPEYLRYLRPRLRLIFDVNNTRGA